MPGERETLVDFLKEQQGYYIKDGCLRRPDKSLAALYANGRWKTYPTQDEFMLYNVFCRRGFPSLLCKDWTNPGSR